MDVSFAMFKSDGSRRDFPMRKERIVIGRKDSCDLRVPLPAVSREHCEVSLAGGELQLRDLGSSNGTFRNGVRVQETTLEAGDQIVIGPVTFTVVVDGEPSEIEPGTRMASGAGAAGDDEGTISSADEAGGGNDLEDSDELSALLAEFDDEDDSFAGLDLDDDEDEKK
jgi:pSer/pThr/pTyr-binding forkhead associated (FHA) protein